MQTSYTRTASRGIAGERASAQNMKVLSRTYPAVKHIVAVSLGGTTNGTYTIRVTPPTGLLPVPYFDASFVASGSTADQIVAGLVAALNASSTVPNLRNLLIASADLPNDDVILTAVRSGEVFTVSFPSNPGTNLTQSTTQDADRDALPFAYALCSVPGTDDVCRLPSSTTTERDVLGLLLRDRLVESSLDGSSSESIAVGETCSILAEGEMYVMPEDDVDVDDPVYVRVTSDGATEILGALRGTPSGSTQVATITPAANMLDYAVEYGYLGATYSFHYSPTDATTAATDASAGLEDAAADDAPSGVTVSAAGGATFTLTAAAGTEFDFVRNAAWSLDAETASTAVSLAAADVEAIEMTRWKWLKAGGPTSGEVAIVRVAH
jgi:hypothetical protein